MRAFILAAFLLASSARADTLETAFDVVWTADMLQTLDIRHHSATLHETNLILGRHPSEGAIVAYFAAGALVHYEVSHLLPVKLQRPWEYVTIGYEVGQVAVNYHLGLRFAF